MPVTQSDIDELNTAIATGERLVRKSDGSTLEFRSIAELIRARDDLQTQLASASPRVRAVKLYHAGRGY